MDTSTSSRAKSQNQFARLMTVASAGGLIFYGVRRRDLRGALFALTGVGIAASGPVKRVARRASELSKQPVRVKSAVTVRATLDEVYSLLRSPEGVFECVESIERRHDGSTRWTINLKGMRIHIDARVEAEQRPRRLLFRAQKSGHLRGEGQFELTPAPGEQGTEIRVQLDLFPSSVALRLAAHALRKAARLALFNELTRVRQLVETGEIATGAMRPEGTRSEQKQRDLRRKEMFVPIPASSVALYPRDLLIPVETD